MDSERRLQVLELLSQFPSLSPSPESLELVFNFIQTSQDLGFLSGVHMGLKELAKTFPRFNDKTGFLVSANRRFPRLFIDLAILLVTERTEDLRPVLYVLLGLLYPCPPSDLSRVVLLSRVLERFPEVDNTFFLDVLNEDEEVMEEIKGKVFDLRYRLIKQRKLRSALSVAELTAHFSPLNAVSPSSQLLPYPPQLLLDLHTLLLDPQLQQTAIPGLFPTRETVKNVLTALSYNDEYLVDATKTLIELGKNRQVFELEAYCVFYHFCCLLEWSLETVFDLLVDSEAELLELLVLFAKEASGSGERWEPYVYVYVIYQERKEEVDELLGELCSQLNSRAELLHFNPITLVRKLQTMLHL